jgi:hypothetical protein
VGGAQTPLGAYVQLQYCDVDNIKLYTVYRLSVVISVPDVPL